MVSLVLISHSPKVVEGLKELVAEMADKAPVFIAGGNADGGLGSNYELIKDVLQQAYTSDGVIILYDLGSSAMTAELVLEEMDDTEKIKIVNAPLVEGAIVAAVEINSGANFEDVLSVLEEIEMIK